MNPTIKTAAEIADTYATRLPSGERSALIMKIAEAMQEYGEQRYIEGAAPWAKNLKLDRHESA